VEAQGTNFGAEEDAMRLAFGAIVLLTLLPLAGCQPSASPSGPSASTQPAAARIEPAAGAATASTEQATEETWDAYSMQGVRVGYGHTVVSRVVAEGRDLVRTSSRIHTEMQRSGQPITQNMTLVSWDTPDGKLVRFESRMSDGKSEIASVGAVAGGQLGIDTTILGRTQSQKIPWQADGGGFFAPEQSLRKQPLAPGDKRTVRGLVPMLNMPGDTQLEALDYETVDLPAGKTKLLKVKYVVNLGPQKIEQFVWINEKGETLKSLVPSIQQESVRTTKADALQQSGQRYDLIAASTVRLKGTLPNPRQTTRAVYRARLKSGQIYNLFSDGPSQHVRPIDDQTAEITVLAITPDEPKQLDQPQPQPGPADTAPSNVIQSDDRLVAEMAGHVAKAETEPWKIACELEEFVRDAVRNKDFSQAFATAAEVARSLEGDCTEHSVLLAALCRARKIPARVAFGLVYFPPANGFAYHMWNEVWINDRWVPLDATLGQGGIAADHIKLGDSNLFGGSPLADLLAVIQVFGRLELEVVETE
jgi:hypothetical protein